MRPLIICDQAEARSRVPERIAERGCDVEVAALPVGDYLLSSALAIERKTASDLVSSIISGRLTNQLSELSETYEHGLLLIEGDSWEGDRRLKTPMLARITHWLTLRPNLGLVYSPTSAYTARLLAEMARCEQDERAALPPRIPTVVPRRAPMPRAVIQAFPGVGPAGADRLLARFGDIRGICAADRAALIAEIGPKRGERLHSFLSLPDGKASDQTGDGEHRNRTERHGKDTTSTSRRSAATESPEPTIADSTLQHRR